MEIMKQYRDDSGQHDIVCLAGEQLYQNHYSVWEDSCGLRHPSSTAGYFNSLTEAVDTMHKHRPTARNIRKPARLHLHGASNSNLLPR